MKILHLMLGCFYIDNYSYQENYLPKYHKKMGHDVEIVASLVSFDKTGKYILLDKPEKYINEYEIPVSRLEYKRGFLAKKTRRYVGLDIELRRIRPDIIFIHGPQFLDIKKVAKYCKNNPNVIVYVDNHSDFSNSAKNFVSKNILHKLIWKKCAQIILPYTKKFYGVLPARVKFLEDVYDIPKEKIDLLVMGADDELVEEAKKIDKNKQRELFHCNPEDFVIVTGGKIDFNKTQILLLMKTIHDLNKNNVKLLIFGTVIDELKETFYSYLNDRVKYLGWFNSSDLYKCLMCGDLICFPGLHSVLWEQSVALGIPCIFKKIDGFTHVDIGGNCLFFDEETVDSYEKIINKAIKDIDYMKYNSGKVYDMFLYSNISKKSIEEN